VSQVVPAFAERLRVPPIRLKNKKAQSLLENRFSILQLRFIENWNHPLTPALSPKKGEGKRKLRMI